MKASHTDPLFELMTQGVWQVDAAGKTIFVNARMCAMVGYSREEFVSLPSLALVAEKDRGWIATRIASRREGVRDDYECQIAHKDGSWVSVTVEAVPVFGDDGKYEGTFALVTDITERERAEEQQLALEASQRVAHLGNWTWDVKTNRLEWSDEMFRIFGIDRQGFTGDLAAVIAAAIHPDDREAVERANRSVAEEGRPTPLEYRVVRPDGTLRVVWAEAGELVRDADGSPALLTGIVQDITERRRAEEALKESDERNRAVTRSAHAAIVSSDSAGMLVGWNHGAETLFGYAESEIVGQPLTLLMPERFRERHLAGMSRVASGGEHRVMGRVVELVGRRKDGSEFPLELSLATWGTAAGRFFTGIIRDITERKRAEELLTLRVRLHEFAADHSLAELLRKTLDEAELLTGSQVGFYHFVEADQRTLSLQEWSSRTAEEFCTAAGSGQHYSVDDAGVWVDCVHQRRPVIHNDYAALPHKKGLPEGHAPVIRELVVPIFRKDKIVAILGVGNKTTDYTEADVSTVTYLADVAWEVAERKRVDEALRQSQYFFEESQQAAFIGSYRTDFAKGVWVSSEVLDQIFGIDAGYQRTVEGWLDIVHPDDKEMMSRYLTEEVIGKRKPFIQDYRIVRRSDRETRWVHGRGTVDFDERGNLLSMIGTIQDITDRRRAEKERAKLESQLHQAQKMESVGRLAGGVAHDFNNMLGVILGNTEAALEQVDPMSPLHEDLEEIRKAATRSAELTRQLLAFARKQTITPKVLNLNDTVAGMLRLLERLIGEDVRVTWQPGEGLWPLHVDPSQIDQILTNLCVNARDAISGVGKLTIETGNATLDEDYRDAHEGAVPGDYVRLSVSDDGCGMDKETQSHLFEPFFTTKEVGKGTGLGLATVYGIVKQNNGFIEVTSEPGHGATFTIYLPRHHQGMTARGRTPGDAEPTVQGHETILVVEDEVAILRLTKRMLERMGYTVLTAGTPGDALRLAEAHSGEVHLLMTDVVMPEMNGRDLAKNLLSRYPGLKRLFMSGYTADVIASHGVLDEGVNFLQKPFSKEELAAKVREALDGVQANGKVKLP